MLFIELVLQNFGPYRGKQILNFRPEGQDQTPPIVLLGGMNGGGKTTLMDAIRLALYGNRAQCSTRGNLSYSDFLDQCVNQHTPPIEDTRVELLIEHIANGERIELRIIRQWYKNNKEGKDNLGILKEDWLDEGLTSTWDEYIEKMLPLGISNLFLFDGEQVKELADQEEPTAPVIEAIQSLLGLELAERLGLDLEVLLSRKRKELASKKELNDLEVIEKRLSKLNQDLELHKQKQTELQKNLEQVHQKRQETYDKFVSEGGKFALGHNQLNKELQSLKAVSEEKRNRLRNLASKTLPLALITPLLNQGQIQGEKELKIQEAKITSDVLQKRDKRLLAYLADLAFDHPQIDKIKTFFAQENQDIETHLKNSEKPWLEVDPDVLNDLSNLLNYHLPNQYQEAQNNCHQLEASEAEITSKEMQLATAASPEDFEKLEDNLNHAQNLVTKAKIAYDAGIKKREQLENAIAQTKKELTTYSERVIDRHNKEHLITSATKVQKTIEQFKQRLTIKKLNKLEVEVTECFRYLLHKTDLVHRISIDTYKFSLSLYDTQGKPVPKHRLSAGEKQLLAISFLWGLARVSGRRLPVAIDTPLGRLDSSHRSNLVERYFPSASHQVILLSTDTEIGKKEVEQLREQNAIAQEYLLHYDPDKRETAVKPGYFW